MILALQQSLRVYSTSIFQFLLTFYLILLEERYWLSRYVPNTIDKPHHTKSYTGISTTLAKFWWLLMCGRLILFVCFIWNKGYERSPYKIWGVCYHAPRALQQDSNQRVECRCAPPLITGHPSILTFLLFYLKRVFLWLIIYYYNRACSTWWSSRWSKYHTM